MKWLSGFAFFSKTLKCPINVQPAVYALNYISVCVVEITHKYPYPLYIYDVSMLLQSSLQVLLVLGHWSQNLLEQQEYLIVKGMRLHLLIASSNLRKVLNAIMYWWIVELFSTALKALTVNIPILLMTMKVTTKVLIQMMKTLIEIGRAHV